MGSTGSDQRFVDGAELPSYPFQGDRWKRNCRGRIASNSNLTRRSRNQKARQKLRFSIRESANGAICFSRRFSSSSCFQRFASSLFKFGDVDGDYDLDMVRCGSTATLYRNETTNTALKLKLAPKSCAETSLGCSIWVYQAGKLGDSKSLIHYRQCFMPHGMHRSTILNTTLHVGLGQAASADVRVRFADGRIKEAKGVKAKTAAICGKSREPKERRVVI